MVMKQNRLIISIGAVLILLTLSLTSAVSIKSIEDVEFNGQDFPTHYYETSTFSLNGNILYVGGGGPGNYSSIQVAIDDAGDGDTVFVYDDSSPYYENIVVNKSINVVGENKDTTIIDGNGGEYVVLLSAEGVSISHFSIQNSSDSGIESRSIGNTISDNIVTNCEGIKLRGTLYNNVIRNRCENLSVGIGVSNAWYNTISENYITNGWGIWCWDSTFNNITKNILINNSNGIYLYLGSYFIITDNLIINNNNDGIDLLDVRECQVTGNVIRGNNGQGIDLSHYLYFQPNNNVISKNNIENNEGDGIHIYTARDNTISWNTITGNKLNGIYHRMSASHNMIFKNHIADNNNTGVNITADYNHHNQIYQNNFMNNNQNAYDEGNNNMWDNNVSEGNYWDDFQDNPGYPDQYNISGGSSQDRYPLEEPYSLPFIRGDANADMEVTMSDTINLLRYMYVPGSPALTCMDSGDSNDDGSISMADAMYILKHLYVPGSPEPPSPYPSCGIDPTDDDLTCLSHPCMG